MPNLCQTTLRIAILGWAATLACSTGAEDKAAQTRLFAAPAKGSVDPFRPSRLATVELPVALGGYCAVSLRDQQEWVQGVRQIQVVFDGQIYWFAGQRELGIFSARPHEYMPVLGGDCVVTFASTGDRVPGNLRCGLAHNGRIYLFAGDSQREHFRKHPSQYADADLAENGNCIVTWIDEARRAAGLPETVAIVNGMRYMFAGDFERRTFAQNMARYGVKRQLLTSIASQHGRTRVESPTPSKSTQTERKSSHKAQPLPTEDDGSESVGSTRFVMDGYCPVSILTNSVWVRGSFQYEVEYEGSRYLLAGEQEKQQFLASPKKFLPAAGGNCIVSQTDRNEELPGIVKYTIYDPETEQLFLFAGAEEKAAFAADPEKYRAQVVGKMSEAPKQIEAEAPATQQEADLNQ